MMFFMGGSFYHQDGGSFDPPLAEGRSVKCSEYDVRAAGTWRAPLLIMQTETWTDALLAIDDSSYVAFIDAIEVEATETGIPCETSVDDATLALWSL